MSWRSAISALALEMPSRLILLKMFISRFQPVEIALVSVELVDVFDFHCAKCDLRFGTFLEHEGSTTLPEALPCASPDQLPPTTGTWNQRYPIG